MGRGLLVCLLAVGGCAGVGERGVEIIAHRGASYLAPENTVAAAEVAWEVGADAVEVDVYLSADGRMVVIHDRNTKRTSGVDLAVAKTDAAVLRSLDVGRFKGEEFAGEKIPFLREILATVPPGKRLFVEIECGPEIVEPLREAIEASGRQEQVVIICFDLEVAAEAKRAMPGREVYWLVGARKDPETGEALEHDAGNVRIAAERGLDGLDVHFAGVTEGFMEAVRGAGQRLYVWTVDDAQEARRLAALGVAGITTNRPGWMREQLR